MRKSSGQEIMRTAIKRLIFLWLAAALGCCRAETLLVFGDDAYPPVIYLANGVPAGILPSILNSASAITGDVYDLRLFPWNRSYNQAMRGDGGVVGLSLNQERVAVFDYSKPIYTDEIVVVTLRDRSFHFSRIEDLKDKVIGGVSGASYGEEVDRAIAAGLFSMDRDVGSVGRLRKLLSRRLDAAFIGNGQSGFDSIVNSSQELKENRHRFIVLPKPLAIDRLYLAFPKSMNKQAAIDRLNTALNTLKQRGAVAAIEREALRQ
jgi:polar amino acid transport system substrate-binding protein